MKFSLVLSTIGRVQEVERFLTALEEQHDPDLELIVVDQNSDDRLPPVLESFQGRVPIIRVRSARGLSLARNVGLRYISGDVIAFPDDDCWYPPGLLSSLRDWLGVHPDRDGISLTSRDALGKYSNGHWDRRGGLIALHNVWQRGISYTIFLRRNVVERVGKFDENLGVGARTPWGSGEETDYLIRAIKAGHRLEYNPALSVCHPQCLSNDSITARAHNYGMGCGYVLRKNDYPLYLVIYAWVRSLGGAMISLTQFDVARARRHWAMFLGRVQGWLS